MRNSLFCLIFFLLSPIMYAASGNSSAELHELDKLIADKQLYVEQKEEQIAGIKRLLADEHTPLQRYQLNRAIYKEYHKFSLDSAISYAKQNLQIARACQQRSLLNAVQLDMVVMYAASGRFREAEQLLGQVDRQHLDEELLPEYYEAYIRFFDYYQGNNPDIDYLAEVAVYRDSLLSVLTPGSFRYRINQLQQEINKGYPEKAETELLSLLADCREEDGNYPMITYLLGMIYMLKQQEDMAGTYYARSSISDIRQAIKDNASIQQLAAMCYEQGDIDRAYLYAGSAIEDALFCNVHFRTVYLSQFYTIVNAAYREKEADRRNELLFYLLLISLLSLFLILAVAYVSRQVRKVSRIKEELAGMNHRLVELNNDIVHKNEQLNERNAQLSESNHIKEEYIAYFFDLCSAYINKLEDYRKSLYKKASAKQTEELFKMLRSTTLVENELEELYTNFDTIFLNLYPDFVKEFNALLPSDEQILVKPGELLNTELRIFALVRLGITDSVKIASFLRYSLSTIYNYRTKARSKAGVSRDEFEKRLMRIGNTAFRKD